MVFWWYVKKYWFFKEFESFLKRFVKLLTARKPKFLRDLCV